MELVANRYTFGWRKSVVKYREWQEKINAINLENRRKRELHQIKTFKE